VGSSKTLNLLATAHNYRRQHKRVVLVKPGLDTRGNGERTVASRAGLEQEADIVLDNDTEWRDEWVHDSDCVLVDEAQFLSVEHVEELRRIVDEFNVPVICYGLRTDFRTRLFDASKRLMELADSIEEIKTTCHYCNRKATCSMRVDGDGSTGTLVGPTIQMGFEELYLAVCFAHFRLETCVELGRNASSSIIERQAGGDEQVSDLVP